MNFGTSNPTWWKQASRSIRAVPPDLAGILGFVVLVNLVFLVPGLRDTTIGSAPLRTLLGIPALLFVPGYVLVSIAFPASPYHSRRASVDVPERLALAFGLSVAILPLVGISLGAVWELTTSAILTSLTVLVVAGVGVATIRQLRLKPEERFGTALANWTSDRTSTTRRRPTTSAMTLLLAFAVLVAVGSVGYAVATPYQSGAFSTFSVVTENETGTELAAGYPGTVSVGEPQQLRVRVENDEEQPQAYTVVATLERVDQGGGELTVTESEELTRFHGAVVAGETWTEPHTVAPEMSGEDLRLHYYLYKGGTAPSTPDASTAYRDLHLWMDVVAA